MDFETIPTLIVREEQVLELLTTINTEKSPGPDSVHPRILKELREELSSVIADIFNTTLNESRLPMDWITANISAIFKKGQKTNPSNYRPVSLTSVVCKVMEKNHQRPYIKPCYEFRTVV